MDVVTYQADVSTNIASSVDGGGKIAMQIDNVQKYLDVLVPVEDVATPNEQSLIEVGQLHVFNIDTENTVFDLNCFVEESACTAETTTIQTAF